MEKEITLQVLENRLSEVKKRIHIIDISLYGNGRKDLIYGISRKEIDKVESNLANERFVLVKERDKISAEIRRRKGSGLKHFSSKALSHGAYTDADYRTFKPTARGHFQAIGGITL